MEASALDINLLKKINKEALIDVLNSVGRLLFIVSIQFERSSRYMAPRRSSWILP